MVSARHLTWRLRTSKMAHPTATGPSSEVTLTISCRGLADTDVFSKSDPIVVVYMEEVGKWGEVSYMFD